MQKGLLITAASLGVALTLSSAAFAGSSKDGEPSKTKSKQVAVAATQPAPVPQPKTYTVQTGDNLSDIAQTEQLASWHPLWNANPGLTDPNLIYAGQQLVVPTGPTTDRPLPDSSVAPATETSYVPSQSQTYTRSAAPANYAAGAGGLLARIRQRESGGNYAENTGNGYYGAYQFSLGTWEGVGGSGLPSNASPAEQDMRAQMLFNERGCSPWPNTCY